MINLKICNRGLQLGLEEFIGNKQQLRPLPTLNFLLAEGVRYPTAKNIIRKDGTKTRYQIKTVKKNCDPVGDCATTNLCNSTEPLLHLTSIDEREITKCHTSKAYAINKEDLRDLCDGDTPQSVIATMVTGLIEPFMYSFNEKLLSEIWAIAGVHPITGAVQTSFPLIDNNYVPTPFIQNIALDFTDNGFYEPPTLIGGRVIQMYKRAVANGSTNQFGQNTGAFGDLEAYYESKINNLSQTTRDNALAIAPGVLHFVTFSENAGFFGDSIVNKSWDAILSDLNSGETFHKGVIDLVSLFPQLRELGLSSFVVDIHIKYDDCDNVYKMQFKVNYDIWVMNPELCDAVNGFNGIVKYQFCEPDVPVCTPTKPLEPALPPTVSCFDAPCQFSVSDPYQVTSVNGIGITPAYVTNLAEMVAVLNQVMPGAFSIAGNQIKYVGYLTSLTINNIPVVFGSCVANACYQATSSKPIANAGAYAGFAALQLVSSSATEYIYVLVPLTPQTLVDVQNYENLTTLNGLTWVIPASCV